MASAYSELHNYEQELYSPNLELMSTALQFKQGTYNANKAKLQTLWDQFSFLDVAKGQDQEYLEGRLQATKTIMDKYSMLDLSSNNLTNQLISNMGQVVDDNVTNAVISTRMYRSEQAAWNKLKQESPDKYSEINHAYASQAPNAWLNDGNVGSRYNGGGGVIEYTDVQGKLSEKIPEIAKSIKAEWVELAQGGGYFRDQVTKERVSRDKLEAAMDGLLNEQDKRQLQINAWGTYDQMDDQQLEAVYTNHFAPKVDQIQNEIVSLERTIQSTKDPEMKQYREGLLDFYKTQLEAYEANSFENIVNNYGREAAYNTLYDNQFRSTYLDTYSYMDRITKIATYDNDVKQRNYEYKLDHLQLLKDKEAFDQMIDVEKLELERKKAENSGGSSTARPGEHGYVAPLVTREVPIGYEDVDISMIEQHQKKNQEVVGQMSELFGVESPDDLKKLSKIFNEGFAGKKTISFNGKEIDVSENLDLLLEYQNRILTTSPIEQAAMDQYNEIVDKSLSTLRKVTQGVDPDWVAGDSVPAFQFYFKKNEEGVMEKIPLERKGVNPYAYLLGKENLTEEEQFTLGVYHKMHLLMDPTLKGFEKEMVFEELQTNQLAKVTPESYNSLPSDISSYERLGQYGKNPSPHMGNMWANKDALKLMTEDGFFTRQNIVTKNNEGVVNAPSNYGKTYRDLENAYIEYGNASTESSKTQARDKIQKLEYQLTMDQNLISQRSPSSAGEDFYLSDITDRDSEYYDKNGKEVSLDSPADLLKNGMTLYSNTLEQVYKEQEMAPSLYAQVFNEGTSGYDNLTSLIGLPSTNKAPIKLTRVWDSESNQPTEEVSWETSIKVDGDWAKISSEDDGRERLTATQLGENGIIEYGVVSRVNYNATWGENAPVLDLGNNEYDQNIKEDNSLRLNMPFNPQDTKNLFDFSEEVGGTEFRKKLYQQFDAFQNGHYEFKMEAIDGVWQMSMYDGFGNRVYNRYVDENDPTSEYTNQEVKTIFQDGQYHVQLTMYNYLYNQISELYEVRNYAGEETFFEMLKKENQ